jgi:hypothetical protein
MREISWFVRANSPEVVLNVIVLVARQLFASARELRSRVQDGMEIRSSAGQTELMPCCGYSAGSSVG